jgi:hypothetical protein
VPASIMFEHRSDVSARRGRSLGQIP